MNNILYVGQKAEKNQAGVYIWKLREELSEALDRVDLSAVKLYKDGSKDKDNERHYWWLNANPKIWSFTDLPVGGNQTYSLYNDNGNKRRIFQNFLDARQGDPVIGYVSNPVKQIVALAEIAKKSDGNELPFTKTEGLLSPIDYAQLKDNPDLAQMEFFTNANGSLFKLTKAEYDTIMDIIREANPIPEKKPIKPYTKENFLKDVFMEEKDYYDLASLLKHKGNIILQGAPGVGKTFVSRKLAYSLMGEEDDSRIEFVQFHQNYSYEDFIMGYKPTETGFALKEGVFYRFCRKAQNQPGKDFFFIIDEINRGNMSKIFGELLMLIEKDYRNQKATLAYKEEPFSVPQNLYIIGMMNTADRSLALIDYALRRRFSFFEMNPSFDTELFKAYQDGLHNATFDRLVARVKDLNKAIREDDSLGDGFQIGHSYFCTEEAKTEEGLREIVRYDLIPTLKEYWFDDKKALEKWTNILMGVFDEQQ